VRAARQRTACARGANVPRGESPRAQQGRRTLRACRQRRAQHLVVLVLGVHRRNTQRVQEGASTVPAGGAHLLATRGPSCAVCGAQSPWRVSADATPAREGRAPHTSAMMSGLLARLLQLLLRRKASSTRGGSAIEAAPEPKVLVELRGRRWVARARLRVPERSPLTVAGDRVFSCTSCRTHCGDADAVIAKARARARAARSGAAYARREPPDTNKLATPASRAQTFTGRHGRAFLISQLCVRIGAARRSASFAPARRARALSFPNSRELTHQSLAAALRPGAPHVARGRAGLACSVARRALAAMRLR
jgi:hypothetical protein